jgi:hypothetical protein
VSAIRKSIELRRIKIVGFRKSSASLGSVGTAISSAFEGDRMARSVIQITADPSYLYALCNDGAIFRLVNHAWQPMAPIPQDEPRYGGVKAGLDPHHDGLNWEKANAASSGQL